MLILRSLRTNQSGAAMVELAFIILPLMVLLIGTLETVLVSVARASLDANVQAQAYDTTNADAMQMPTLTTRSSFCQRDGFYLVDCQASDAFCFSVVAIDSVSSSEIDSYPCHPGTSQGPNLQGTLAYIVEYDVPVYFDLFGSIADLGQGGSRRTRIRSVALAVR